MGVAASSLFQECERFFQQAEALAPVSSTLSLSECRDFLTQAASLLHVPGEEDLFTASESFLAEAERLMPPPSVPLEEYQDFLGMAEGRLLEHWRGQIDRLREADPRNRPDFQAVNLLEVFGISRQEAPHSRFLGWLLDPRGSHGLGTVFLNSFLELVQRAHGFEFEADVRDVRVELERGTDRGVPDITIIGSNFLCVVENKLLAAEGRDQTRRYADAAEEEACQRGIPSAHLLLVFLSPSGRRPKDSRFHALAYPPLLQLLEDILDRGTPPVVEMAIRQFVFNLRARVLHEYDHSTAALTHLAGYAEQGDQYLRGHWPEIGNLIEALREVNNMSGLRVSAMSLCCTLRSTISFVR
jgi:hypothetical protein